MPDAFVPVNPHCVADDRVSVSMQPLTKRFLLIVPDGMGIRNFLCTDFIDRLLEAGDVCVWHALPEASLSPFQQRWEKRVRWEGIPAIYDGRLERFLRKAKHYAQLYWKLEEGGREALRVSHRSDRWRTRALELAGKAVGRLCANPRGIVALDRLHQASAARANHMREFGAFVEDFRPDVVFCVHQRALYAVPAMLAARALGIPTATFIYSWDNLPKGRMPVAADYYLVWSEFMKSELLSLYPDVTTERVRVVGTPQFESYQDRSLVLPRDEFLTSVGLDSARPVVCFSGDDVLTSPYDPAYLEDLAESLRSIDASERPQILFRRCPVDLADRYNAVLSRYPEIAVSNPRWDSYGESDWWGNVVPTQEDVALLVNVVSHSDLVVNLGSTMAMDFAVYDKPAIFLAYTPRGAGGRWRAEEVYQLPHLRSVHELQPVYWVRSPEELGAVVLYALRHPAEGSRARQAWLNRHVLQPLASASARCARVLFELTSEFRNVSDPKRQPPIGR